MSVSCCSLFGCLERERRRYRDHLGAMECSSYHPQAWTNGLISRHPVNGVNGPRSSPLMCSYDEDIVLFNWSLSRSTPRGARPALDVSNGPL